MDYVDRLTALRVDNDISQKTIADHEGILCLLFHDTFLPPNALRLSTPNAG